MKIKKCVCNRKAELYHNDDGFMVACTRCGRETKTYLTPESAILNWNKTKEWQEINENEVINL